MSRTLDEANREISAVRGMPYGLARTQAAERQVRVVEAEGPDEARAFALSTLVEAYNWGGEPEKSFVPFAQLLRWWDEHPEKFDEYDRHGMFWSYKRMVSELANFPTVPAAQIDRTLADMERRYALAGNGMDAVAYERFAWARQRGSSDVEQHFQAWVATPRDDFSQCEACDPGDRASWLIATDRVDEGIRLIEQTLTTDPSCASEPADMLSYLAEAYLLTGRAQDAARAYRRAVAALAEADSDMVGARGRRIRLLARGGQPTRAIRAIEEEQHLLTGGDSPYSRLVFSVLVGAATHVLRAEHADAPVRLTGVPAATVAELDDWLRAQADELAAAFDARNGTAGESETVAQAWATEPAGVVLDLDVLPRGAGLAGGAGPAGGGAATGSGSGAPAGSGAAADPGASITDPAALIAEAERLSGAGDTEGAATAYLRAATAAESAGLLVESGFCYAEAAYCAQTLGDDDGAAGAYEAAVARLTAGGAEPATVAPVVVQWARAAAVAGGADRVLATVETLVAALAAQQPAPDLAEDLAKKAEAERRRTTADLQDAAARLLATRGDDAGAVEGARLAQQAAEAFGGLGAIADAAHAFWLAGRLHDRLGQVDEAVWNLESAVEGFAMVRRRDQRGEVANLLIDVLRRSGQVARAEALAAELTA
jgi:tetratricopeptide (TPR) repeat protein